MPSLDPQRLAAWGAPGCSNSHYLLARTTCCRRFVMEDAELGDLYLDPRDPRRMGTSHACGACPLCGAARWDYVHATTWPRPPTGWEWARATTPERAR